MLFRSIVVDVALVSSVDEPSRLETSGSHPRCRLSKLIDRQDLVIACIPVENILGIDPWPVIETRSNNPRRSTRIDLQPERNGGSEGD